MSIIEQRRAQLFPVFNAAQLAIARRFAVGEPRRYEAGALLFDVGEAGAPAFLILSGEVEIHRRDGAGSEALITRHATGEITGEISQLGGRASLAAGRAGPEGCEVLAFDAAHLRALIIGSADIGEILMRAFILRRTSLIADGGAGSVLLGRQGQPGLVRIQTFLNRNGYPHSVLASDDGAAGAAMVERLGLGKEDLPIVLCPNGSVLKNPTDREVGACLGITPDLDENRVYDIAVVGAGPAGLATAVYAASEGLSVIVLDARAFGGQAGASARIENYLGFPTGISGHVLMARASTQAQKFGAEIAVPICVESLDCGGEARRPGDLFGLRLGGGKSLKARSVVIASGARYRPLDVENLAMFEGAGVSYWASPVEAKLCEGEEVALIGAGNSAGQAVAFLAPRVKKLHMVVRAAGLEASMSSYLIDRIKALPNVEIHTRSEVTALRGDAATGLEGASFRHRDTGESWTGPLRHLFLFIGADPNTDWLEGCTVAVDGKGFVLTGAPVGDEAGKTPWSAFGRAPMPLETSVPGIFAIGDVRANSTKRVAAAVGEGAQVVAAVHAFLAHASLAQASLAQASLAEASLAEASLAKGSLAHADEATH